MIVSITPDEVQCLVEAIYYAAPRLSAAEKMQLNTLLSRMQNELAAQMQTSSLQSQVPQTDQASSASKSGGEEYQRSDISQSTLNGSSG